jgi:hypothetical protein
MPRPAQLHLSINRTTDANWAVAALQTDGPRVSFTLFYFLQKQEWMISERSCCNIPIIPRQYGQFSRHYHPESPWILQHRRQTITAWVRLKAHYIDSLHTKALLRTTLWHFTCVLHISDQGSSNREYRVQTYVRALFYVVTFESFINPPVYIFQDNCHLV